MVDALLDRGAVVIEGLLDADLLGRFNTEIDPYLDAAPSDHAGAFVNEAIAAFFGDRTRHITQVVARSTVFAREILVHPVMLGLADAVLLPGCADYLLNIAHVLDRGPGAQQQFLHRDEDVWVHVPRPHQELQLACMMALVDFTADNGATVVVPGSHRWERDRQPAAHELVPAVMPAGSAVVYLGSTIHAGGTNSTADVHRRGMHVSYCTGWLRTEENHYLTTPIELVRSLPRRNQQLLGYGAHDALRSGGGYLGTVDLQDPGVLLANGQL